jgi:alpha-glucosidase (family GH31 glycosyl hydrolase)
MELFVRMAECSALFPMMQFSWAPWDALDKPHLGCVKRAHDLHIEFSDQIWTLVQSAAKTGEPILRNLEYNYPGRGFEKINDEFMLGEEILVAPIIEKGQKTRTIKLPEGDWRGFDGKSYVGNETYKINVTLADLPYFILQ